MILVLSDPADETAAVVLRALAGAGHRAVPLDLAAFPERASLTLRDGDPSRSVLDVPGHGPLRLADVEAIWSWRPAPFQPAAAVTDPQHRAFVYDECYEAFAGLWPSLPVRWVNHPERDALAAHKTYQLAVARRLGFSLPRTCVTNDPGAAREFLASCGGARTIYKALSATPATWRPTRLVGSGELGRLEGVRHAPVTFQEYVPGVDLRVSVVGERLFPVAVDARATASPHDFRPVFDEARVEVATLPPDVAARISALVAELGLAYAALDLRRRDDGEHVFLEVNPGGLWLWMEERTGLPITDALVRLLAG